MEQYNKKQNAALLVMDIQQATVNMLGDAAPLMKSLTIAIQKARKNKIPVIYVVIGFRKGYPEASANNKSFSMIKTGSMNFDTEEAAKVHML